jgi:hypothetical protein
VLDDRPVVGAACLDHLDHCVRLVGHIDPVQDEHTSLRLSQKMVTRLQPVMRHQCTDFDYHPHTYLADFVPSVGCLLPLSLTPRGLVSISHLSPSAL